MERTEDTTQPRAARRSGSRELAAIASVLRKLRLAERRTGSFADHFEYEPLRANL